MSLERGQVSPELRVMATPRQQATGGVFFDPMVCIPEAVLHAKRRNKLAVRARLAGKLVQAREHQGFADWYIARARMWLNALEAKELGS